MTTRILLTSVLSLAGLTLGCNSGKLDDTGTMSTGTDAGSTDAGSTDAGSTDGGGTDGGGTDGGGTSTWTSDCPALSVSETAISFDAIGVDTTASATVVLTNACTGEGDLDVSATISGDEAFIGALPSTTLSPGRTATVDITFAPTAYGEHSGSLLVTSNDADLPSTELPLLGSVIPDADGDGQDAIGAGGTDCNDNDASIYSKDAEDAQDLIDDDCDGTIDEDWIDLGDVYMTELMINPVAVGDAYGEWFELRNDAGFTVDLTGWRFTSDDGDELLIEDSLQVDDGGLLVFGVTDDTLLNGGVHVDVVYSRDDFSLADSADSIFLYMGSTPMAELSYGSDWPLTDGASLALDPTFGPGDNLTVPDVWCAGVLDYGVGDLGSPGDANAYCTSVDHDGDGYSEDTGDCDDDNADIFPGQTELWDGIDNNCDGDVDVVGPNDATSYIMGNGSDYLGAQDGLSIGDLTGDGTPDLLVGGAYLASSSQGVTAVIDGTDWDGWADTWDDVDTASVTGTGYYNYLSFTGRTQGDQDGDGTTDLVVVGSDIYSSSYYGYATAAVLMFGGSDLTGSHTTADSFDVTFSNTTAGYSSGLRVESALDFDGDGFDDVLYGNSTSTVSRSYYTGTVSIMSGADLTSGNDYDFEEDYSLRTWGDESYAEFGDSLGGGDVDGDGYDEIFIGAPGYYYDSRTIGYVYVIAGGTSTLGGAGSVGLIASSRFEGATAGDRLGLAASPIIADFDGDDNMDLALAAPDIGTVYVFHDAASLSGEIVASEADSIITGVGPSQFGHSMYAGDFNGDGADDLVVGAPDTSSGTYISYYADEPGQVYIFDGTDLSGDLSSTDATYTVVSDTVDGAGMNVNGADFDGDGTDELIVDAPGYSSSAGRIWVFNP